MKTGGFQAIRAQWRMKDTQHYLLIYISATLARRNSKTEQLRAGAALVLPTVLSSPGPASSGPLREPSQHPRAVETSWFELVRWLFLLRNITEASLVDCVVRLCSSGSLRSWPVWGLAVAPDTLITTSTTTDFSRMVVKETTSPTWDYPVVVWQENLRLFYLSCCCSDSSRPSWPVGHPGWRWIWSSTPYQAGTPARPAAGRRSETKL